MQPEFIRILSLIFSIILALPQVPKALFDYIRSVTTQNIVQYERLEAMRIGNIEHIDEQLFANFNLDDPTVKYNEVRTLTTHNSYKKALPQSLYALSTAVFGPKKFKSIMYEHDTPVAQLNNGVRGLELDVRWQLNGFKIHHQPALDNLSNSPDWIMTLEELRLWSDSNPGHVPVTVLVEFKNDDPRRNPLFRKMDEKKFRELDRTIKSVIGEEKVVTAADLTGDAYATLGEMVEQNGWPSLCSMKGKFIFLLHPDSEYTDVYINMDKSLKTQMFIPVVTTGNIESHTDYAAFILYNTPDTAPIRELVGRHYIVRAFMDSGQQFDETYKANALASGAQLLTTDLEKGVILPKTDYAATLEGKYTIICGRSCSLK